MRGRSIRAFLFVLPAMFACLAAGGAALAETRPDKQFSDWRTTVFSGNNTVFVLYTPDSNSKAELQMGKILGNCNSTKVYLAIGFGQQSDKDYSREQVSGEVRVDQQPVHKTVSRIAWKAGSKDSGYDVHSFENPQALLQEMNSGQVIRFKFTLDSQEYYYRFSLNGFSPAYERVAQLCAQGAQGRGERPGAKPGQCSKPKSPKSDADYFDDPKPSPGSKAPKSDKDFF